MIARFGPWRKDHTDKTLDGVEPARKTIDQLFHTGHAPEGRYLDTASTQAKNFLTTQLYASRGLPWYRHCNSSCALRGASVACKAPRSSTANPLQTNF